MYGNSRVKGNEIIIKKFFCFNKWGFPTKLIKTTDASIYTK